MSHHQSHAGHECHSGVTDRRRLLIAFLIIFTFMIIEVVGGILSGSLALLADAGHMATDSVALLLAFSAKWLADKKSHSQRFPFGFQRAQVLAGFVNGLGLFVLVGWLVWEAIHRMAQPQEILTGMLLVVAILGLVANLVAFAVLHGGNTDDLNMRGALLHVMSDILGSVAAIMSAILIALTGMVIFDAILTLLVCALVLRSAWPLVSEASRVLLQGSPESVEPDAIERALRENVEGVVDVHDIKIWMLTPDQPQLAMHVQVGNPEQAQPTLQKVKEILCREFGISQSTIQIECSNCPDEGSHTHAHDHEAAPQNVATPSPAGAAEGSNLATS